MELTQSLVQTVQNREASSWLLAELWTDRARFAKAFATAGRKLGTTPISAAAAGNIPIPWPITGVDECGRAAMVASACASLPAEEHVAFVHDLFRRGEVRERQAVLRVLAGLPEPERFTDLAIDAFRTNVQSVFEALACDNAFPARYFTSAQFAQLVLKALFTGAPVGRIHDLAKRIDAELVRMVEAYASERRAAGRPVPEDAKLILR